jgi:hypothetical protein
MTTAVQRRRGTTTEHSSFTGLEGEISVNTTKDTLVVHDGSTVGGFELARADGSNFVATSVDINGGSIDGTTIGSSSASTGAFTTLSASGEITANGGIALGDSDKATFGASDDLQIYHSGTHSFISDVGTGNLYLSAADSFIVRTEGVAVSATFTPAASVALNYAGSTKLATTSTGIDVTGTVVADGLTVDAGASDIAIVFDDNSVTNRYQFTTGGNSLDSYFNINSDATRAAHLKTVSGSVSFDIASGFGRNDINFNGADLFIKRGGTKALEVDQATGDVSLFEDTGTTAKLFWDASAESLGIGTSSPVEKLYVNSTSGDARIGLNAPTGSDAEIKFSNNSVVDYSIGHDDATDNFVIGTVNVDTPLMSVTKAGNVGIGISSGLTYPLTVKSDANNSYIHFVNSTTGSAFSDGSQIGVPSGSTDLLINNRESGNIRVFTSNTERMRIDSSGDMIMKGGRIKVRESDDGNDAVVITRDADEGYVNLYSEGSQTIEIRGNGNSYFNGGNVGIGTSSPSEKLEIAGAASATSTGIAIKNGSATRLRIFHNDNAGTNYISSHDVGAAQALFIMSGNNLLLSGGGGTEHARIDSSGNLLVGTTVSGVGVGNTSTGHNINANGALLASRTTTGDTSVAYFNRNSSDGKIAEFYKDGTTVGSIGVDNASINIGTGNTGLLFYNTATAIYPRTAAGAQSNGAIDLGGASDRFKDLYLSGGVYGGGAFSAGTTGNDVFFAEGVAHIFRRGSGGSYQEFGRFDTSGNLLVGTTSTAVAALTSGGGSVISSAGATAIAYQSVNVTDPVFLLNNTGVDGSIAEFRKDGTTVGSIGTAGGDITIGTGDTGLTFEDLADVIHPINQSTGAARDNAIDLGKSAARFKDLYLSGGVYQSGTRLIKRTATSSGGSTIFASITDAPQTGFIHIYEIGTTNYAILACTKRDTSSDVVTTVVANNVLTVNATNAGGTVAVTGHTTTGNVRMQATIIREA